MHVEMSEENQRSDVTDWRCERMNSQLVENVFGNLKRLCSSEMVFYVPLIDSSGYNTFWFGYAVFHLIREIWMYNEANTEQQVRW